MIDYVQAVSSNIQTVEDNARIQSKYLTLLLNYMEKYQMLMSGRIDEKHMKHLEELNRIRAAYEEALQQCESISKLCMVALSQDDVTSMSDRVLFVPGEKIYLHDDTDSMLIPLNELPERLITPFPFVEALHIKEEIVYESSLYYGCQKDILTGDYDDSIYTSKGAQE